MKIIDDNIIDVTKETLNNKSNKHDISFKKHKEKRKRLTKNKYHSIMIQLILVNQLLVYLLLFYLIIS